MRFKVISQFETSILNEKEIRQLAEYYYNNSEIEAPLTTITDCINFVRRVDEVIILDDQKEA